ncbi:N-6 DNA methylase [Dialister sp.]|uniref:N-6 DNA methylase n=1 Tax=Dialister sp. TaxID=1955814 RepID=UPI002E7FD7C6|nr:N-6 DNA methylase [Dialister sp.]MEE3453364.1 N-6 DNA methylase [Dialister sp.]
MNSKFERYWEEKEKKSAEIQAGMDKLNLTRIGYDIYTLMSKYFPQENVPTASVIYAYLSYAQWLVGEISDIKAEEDPEYEQIYQDYENSGEPLDMLLNYFLDDISNEVKQIIFDYFGNGLWERTRSIIDEDEIGTFCSSPPTEEYRSYILSGKYMYTTKADEYFRTPISIVSLSRKILSADYESPMIDLCSGQGDFLFSEKSMMLESEWEQMTKEKGPWYGIEINQDAWVISYIRKLFMSTSGPRKFLQYANLRCGNVMDLFDKNPYGNQSFDRVFSEPPIGERIPQLNEDMTFGDSGIRVEKGMNLDIAVTILASRLISKKGKAVIILAPGALNKMSSGYSSIRSYLVEHGLVHAVVSLPARLRADTPTALYMLILSRGNEAVRMVNAKEMVTPGRRQNILSDENIDDILKCLEEENKDSILVDNETILNTYGIPLSPKTYFKRETSVKNGLLLDGITTKVYRGAPFSADVLDSYQSMTPTRYRYVRLQDIIYGSLNETMSYLMRIPDEYKDYVVENGDLLISRNGTPFKCAVVEIKEDEKILPAANFFILKLDKGQVNPYYLQAYFYSEKGQEALTQAAGDGTIQVLSKKNLLNLMIPIPSREEQDHVAEEYCDLKNKIENSQRLIHQSDEKMSQLFNKMSELV